MKITYYPIATFLALISTASCTQPFHEETVKTILSHRTRSASDIEPIEIIKYHLEEYGIDITYVTNDSRFAQDLGLDEFFILQLVNDVFNDIEIDEPIDQPFRTVGELVQFIERIIQTNPHSSSINITIEEGLVFELHLNANVSYKNYNQTSLRKIPTDTGNCAMVRSNALLPNNLRNVYWQVVSTKASIEDYCHILWTVKANVALHYSDGSVRNISYTIKVSENIISHTLMYYFSRNTPDMDASTHVSDILDVQEVVIRSIEEVCMCESVTSNTPFEIGLLHSEEVVYVLFSLIGERLHMALPIEEAINFLTVGDLIDYCQRNTSAYESSRHIHHRFAFDLVEKAFAEVLDMNSDDIFVDDTLESIGVDSFGMFEIIDYIERECGIIIARNYLPLFLTHPVSELLQFIISYPLPNI